MRPEDQIRLWRDELIDLTKRNKLISLGKGSGLLTIESPAPVIVLGGLDRGWGFHYPPPTSTEESDESLLVALDAESSDDGAATLRISGVTATRLSASLRSLERRSTSEWIDRGLRVVYVAFGELHWNDGADDLRSPLLMVPVRLERPNPREPYVLVAADEDWTTNPALQVKLEQDYGVVLPDWSDDFQPGTFLDILRREIAGQQRWRVVDAAHVGAFSFSKEAMYRDLKDNEAVIAEHPLTQVLCGQGDGSLDFKLAAEPDLERLTAPDQAVTILDADSTQRQCILAATQDRSFVIEGPPGTGKSQTIANVIAELMRRGDKVLFVSEKAAALDVVKKRLDSVGLGAFVLELHSSKATRKEVATELGRALSHKPVPSRTISGVDLSRLEQRRDKLSRYALALNRRREPLGRSLHQVLGRITSLDALPGAPTPNAIDDTLAAHRLADIVDTAADLGRAWGPVARGEEFAWRDLADPVLAASRPGSIQRNGRDVISALETAQTEAEAVTAELMLEPAVGEADLARIVEIALHVANRPATLQASWLNSTSLASAHETVAATSTLHHDLATLENDLDERAARWQTLNPPDAQRFAELFADAQSLLPLAATFTGPDLRQLLPELEEAHQRSQTLTEQTRKLRERLSFPGAVSVHADIDAAVELGQLAAKEHRPESDWFDSQTLAAVKDALSLLRPLANSCRGQIEKLAPFLNEQVHTLDIEQFFDGPNDVVPKLGRMSGRGRNNRRQLKACSRTGELSDEVIGSVAGIRAWKRTIAEIRALEPDQRKLLGSTYWQAELTDLDVVDTAIQVAQRALEILGTNNSSDGLRRELARGAIGAPTTAALADEVDQSHTQLLAGISNDAVRAALETHTIEQIAARCAASHIALTELVALLDTIQAAGAPDPTLGTGLALLESVAAHHAKAATFNGHGDAATETLGPWWQERATRWTELEHALAWCTRLTELVGTPVGPRHANVLLTAPVDPEGVDAAVSRYQKLFDAFVAEFEPHRAAQLRADSVTSLHSAREQLEHLCNTVGDIQEWRQFSGATARLVADGLGAVMEFAKQHLTVGDQVAPIFERAVLAAWVDKIMATDDDLQPLVSGQRDLLVEEFQKLDRQAVLLSAGQVIEACNERRPNSLSGEAGMISVEAEKKRGHRPIRKLLGDAGGAVQALKPCFMMSPLSVSQYLPTSLSFDVVIFDEASQVRPCDAINAVYRGNRLIVAGDDKQLPPTSFFGMGAGDDSDDWSDDQPEVFESVLGLCRGAGQLPSLPLRWHYRSRHESLITYSNRQFYESRLVTFPGAVASGPDVGVQHFPVTDGIYGRGHSKDNVVEARAVVARILEHAENRPHLSAGVVAFSEPQATRIAMELEAARRNRPDLDSFFTADRLDGFFVKNLENVQGDERDVIIFSVGYGRDEHGKFTMNFGPLNREGGFRRLNVAVTRARHRIELVSSTVAADITDQTNYGVQCLKSYLDYAVRGISALAPAPDTPDPGAAAESPFEEEVLETVRRWGFQAQPQVGHLGYRIDMGIADPRRPGTWALGIECDGAAYHSSLIARDRDRLRQEVLEGLGWRLHRIWGPAWYRNRAGEEARLHQAIVEALRDSPSAPPPTTARLAEPVRVRMEEVDLTAPPSWTVPYSPFVPKRTYYSDLGNSGSNRDLTEAIDEILKAEGPITDELLRIRLGSCWPGQNLTAGRLSKVHQIVTSMLARGTLTQPDKGVLARPGQDLTEVRRADADRRERVTHVPPHEISVALRRLCEDAHSIDQDELTTRAAAIFGWKKRGKDIHPALNRAIQRLLDDGVLQETGDGRLAVAAT